MCMERNPSVKGRESTSLVPDKRSGRLRMTWEGKRMPVLCPLGEKQLLGPAALGSGLGSTLLGKLADLLRWKLVCSVQMELCRCSSSFFTS